VNVHVHKRVKRVHNMSLLQKLPPCTLAGFDLTTHSSDRLGGSRRLYHYICNFVIYIQLDWHLSLATTHTDLSKTDLFWNSLMTIEKSTCLHNTPFDRRWRTRNETHEFFFKLYLKLNFCWLRHYIFFQSNRGCCVFVFCSDLAGFLARTAKLQLQ
jgi:hypothetical protein